MKRLKKLLAAVICTAMTISMCACSGTTPPDPTPSDSGTQLPEGSTFSITYFDVGQADAALVECDGQYMLIDGGNKSDSQKMYAILKEKNIGNLFYIVATDVSDEHIGGLAGALNYATADITFCAVENHSSKAFSDLKNYADKNSSGIREPSVGNKYALSSAEIEFLAVSDSSIILKITYGETVFIFAGDVDAEFEKTIISSGTDIDATVLKVASHGSENATSTAFLRETKPEYAVISSAGSEGYPSEDVLSLMEIASVNLYRTDLHGDIICTSDGKNVSFTTEKQPTRAEDIFKPGKAATIKNEEQKNEPEQTQNPVATTTPTPTPTTTPASSDKPGRQPELESPFSVDELYEANLMTVITANHHTAQTESYFMGTTYYDGTFLVDDRIAKLNTYIYDSGTANYSGWYNGYTFYVNHMERPVQTVYVEAFDGDQYYPYQMDLATYFMNHDEVEFKGKKGNDYL
ncbi:MAG: hypothetical protein J6C76_09270, partial [Oscillospiraceae bacterium]|nr:hypothetical protein [Oscillospiraceae bacterium]